MRPTVAHVRNQFLPLSETFIYQFMRATTGTRPVAFCAERINQDAFAWEDVVCVGYPGKFSVPKLMTCMQRLTRINSFANSMTPMYAAAFERHRPDIVHAHFGVEGTQVMDACRRQKLPLIVSFYGYDLSQVSRDPLMCAAYGKLFQVADRLVALSEDFRCRLLNLGCPPEKIRVVRLGVDPNLFSYRPPAPDSTRPVRFFTTARLVEKKGTRFMLEALARVRRTHPQISYTHIGGGPLETELKALAAHLHISDICDFQGAQPNSTMQAHMREADIFVLPSVVAANGDEEGTPVTIYEAMATGLPVLSTRHSGIPEVVVDGECGYLAPERDSEALAANMIRLIEQPDRWTPMAERGRRLIEERFHVHKEAMKLEAIYQEVLASSH